MRSPRLGPSRAVGLPSGPAGALILSVARVTLMTMRLRFAGIGTAKHINILDRLTARQREAMTSMAGQQFLQQLNRATGASDTIMVPAEFGDLELAE